VGVSVEHLVAERSPAGTIKIQKSRCCVFAWVLGLGTRVGNWAYLGRKLALSGQKKVRISAWVRPMSGDALREVRCEARRVVRYIRF
jgi:hypothetical protein